MSLTWSETENRFSCVEDHIIKHHSNFIYFVVLMDFSLTVKAATLIFISGRGSAISSTKQGKSGSIYNLAKNK